MRTGFPRIRAVALLAVGLGVLLVLDGTGEGRSAQPTGTGSRAAATQPAAAIPAAISVQQPLRFAGLNRSYRLVTPAATRGPLPLLVVLHGASASALQEMQRTGVGGLAGGQAVLAGPESVGPAWNTGAGCCGVAVTDHVDDTGFVTAVIADAQRRAAVDPARIYLLGYSSGGKLAYNVACTDGGALAAIAVYGAGPQAGCPGAAALPFIVGYGDADPEEPLAGAPTDAHGAHPPVAQTLAQLRTLNGCAPSSAAVRTVAPASITTWSACRSGAPVTEVLWHGQDHRWPAAGPGLPAPASGASLIWPLLSAQHRT